jgi:4-amino-4-deoxy-L-arabinose transferase-like glycosyltransferase
VIQGAKLHWFDRVAALALGVAFVGVLLATTDIGFTRDEGFYFRAAFSYLKWLEAVLEGMTSLEFTEPFSKEVIGRHMGSNQEHPVLPKLMFAASYGVFHEWLGWLRPSSAMRLPGMLASGLLVYLVYTFTTEAYGRTAALVACVAVAAMPRPFFHAHLACFDAMMTTAWFFVTVAWWRGLRSWKWAVAAGVLFGVALSIKHNGFFLPFVFLLHLGLLAGTHRLFRRKGEKIPISPRRVLLALGSMATVGPLVWLLLWPNHWYDTVDRVSWYLKFHLNHVHYFQYFFGENLYAPPFPIHFPFTLTAVTVPPITLLASLVGAAALTAVWWTRRNPNDAKGTGWLLALSILVPISVIALPSTPIFGGVKHWLTAMPFLAILAGVGVSACGRAIGAELSRRLPWGKGITVPATAILATLVLLPAIRATAHSHPNGTAYYNELIGGARGAADLGMMRQFWGYASGQSLTFLNDEITHGPVFFQNTTHDAFRMYQRDGDLTRKIRYGQLKNSRYGMIHHQMAFQPLEVQLWSEYETRNPVFVAHHDGVPVLRVYQNRHRAKRERHGPR